MEGMKGMKKEDYAGENGMKHPYKIIEIVYDSPSSKVLRGKDCSTGRTVVLKTGGQGQMPAEAVERLKHEYQVMQQADSPHVAKAVGEAEIDGRYYLVEEYYPGITLSRMLKQGALEMTDFYRIAGQLVSGLRDLHEAGIIHKDVNPANIIYDAVTDRAVFIDFSISTLFQHERMSGTRLSNIEGTLPYIAPEQTGRVNAELDYRADFYSLGITFYEMLTGRCPFEAETPSEMVFVHIAKQPPDLCALLPNIPPMLAAIINKLLSKMAKDRYVSCDGLLYDLERCRTEQEFVLGERDFSRRFEFTHQLYGREAEIVQLKDDYKEAASGSKILVSISGYSGIGKTSLVNRIQEEALAGNGMFLQGKFDQYHSNVPYFAFFEAIRQFCSQILLETEESIREWKVKLSETLGTDAVLLTGKVAELSLLTEDYPALEDMGPLEERTRFKAVLEKFLSLLASPEHPLVLFLDDVHRADMGSMEMLEEIFKNEELVHLMIVMCYRDNEVSDEHPVIHSLNKIVQWGGRVTKIHLKGLDAGSAAQMLADLFHKSAEEMTGLAEVIYKKTGGNPFYIKQFLRLCHSRGYLALNMADGSWDWEEAKIQALPAQENVVDFLAENLDQFSEDTLSLLPFGACIGQSFSVEDLAAVSGQPEGEINRRLVVAVGQEAIYPIEKNVKTGRQSRFQFAHDRFQQVFYTILTPQERMQVHYQIANRYEKRAVSTGDMDERLFEIADHYAKGIEGVADPEERRRIQELLLKAANRCGLVSAFDTAAHYLELLLSQPELENPENCRLLTRIYMEYHSVLCNLVKAEECDRIYGMLCDMVDDPAELVDSCCMQISSYSNRGRYEDAFEIGIALLAKLGVSFPREDFEPALEKEMELFYEEWTTLGDGNISNIKAAADPRESGIGKLFCRLCGPSIFFNPGYSYWTVITAARRLFRYGYTPYALQMYANLIMPLGELRGDYRTAYQAARSAMQLAEKLQYREVIYCIYCLFTLHSCHWYEDLANGIPYAKESIKGNAQMGDFEYACYGYYSAMMAAMESSANVEELWNEVEPALKFAKKTGNYHALGTFYNFEQLCKSLRGELSLSGSFDGGGYSEQEYRKQFEHNLQAQSYYHVIRALTAVIYRDYQTAFRLCRDAIPLLRHVSSFYNVALHNFLYSLSICQVVETKEYGGSPEVKQELMGILKENQDWMEKRSEDVFCNFGHLYLLIEAERKAICGNIGEALQLYDEALEAAGTHNRGLHHAIISDVIALRYEKLGIMSAAKHYLRSTYRLYSDWRAEGKCASMRQDHPDLERHWEYEGARNYTLSEEMIRTATLLDMNSVLKASQAISEELEMDGILKKLISSLLECAGAQNIYYLVKTDSGYAVQAEGHSGSQGGCIVSKRPAEDMEVPLSIVMYVGRTSETVILDDADSSRMYGKDVHIQKCHCKSLLCMPILSKGKMQGILYMENNLAAGVFDRQRKENLMPIAAQLAISLENAYLYENLRFLVDERTKELQEEIRVRQKAQAEVMHLYNNVPGVVFRCRYDRHFSVISANEGLYEYLGYTKEEFAAMGNQMSSVLHPEDFEGMRSRIGTEGGAIQGEYRLLCKDVDVRWISLKAQLFKEDDGKTYVYGVFVDITEEKQLQDRIRELYEKELSHFAQASSDEGSAQGRVNVTQNRVENYKSPDNIAIAKTGDSYEQTVRRMADSAADAAYGEYLRTALDKEQVLAGFAAGKTELHFEYLRKRKDGELFWSRTNCRFHQHPASGDVIAFLYTLDVTEQRLQEQLLGKVTELDYERITEVNIRRDTYRVVSFKPKEEDIVPVQGGFHTAVRLVAERYMEAEARQEYLTKLDTAYIEQALDRQDSYSFTVGMMETQGELQIKRYQVFYISRELGRVCIACTDVTDIIRQEQQQREALTAALAAAKQANAAKTDFLSRMSHEIRTPMNAIIGMSAIAAQSIGEDEHVAECISKIGISSRFLLALINDILDMSRIESGKMLLKNEKIPTEDFLTGLNSICYSQAAAKGVDYECIVDPTLDDFYLGDAMKLQQVLLNILSNAIKFTGEGGKVVFSAALRKKTRSGALLRFIVNDTGIGISEDFLQGVFEPFAQESVGTTALYGGTGLGLSISKSIVDMMGGTITVRSVKGIGSEFTVDIPLGVTEEEMLRRSKKKAVHNFTALKTLVVDDDVAVCESAVATLKEIGVTAEWVDSGRKAVERVRKCREAGRHYDMILIDWKMPEMDGIETVRRIRDIVGQEVTIIIMTAYDWASIEHEARLAGVNLLVSKPMFKSSLISAFSRALGEKEEQDEEIKPVSFDFSGRRVLLVEDNAMNTEVATALLESKGFTVDTAENGLRAIEEFSKSGAGFYDAILMDIRMPLMDGLTAANNIRHMSNADAKTIPIIAMTANAFDDDIEKSKAAGMNAHLTKPIEPERLFQVLHNFIMDMEAE
ncbi:response regulator [Clostridium sp. AF15-17LB]|nr:response regulator [Clostridium sp. AF15-17LB]